MTRKNPPAASQRRPRVTHYEYVDGSAFCGARGRQLRLSPQEENVTCRRCLHRIGIQDVAESGRRWA